MTIHEGDCIEVMAGMPADSVDAVCTDPPYGLEFMGKAWDNFRPTHGNWNDAKWAGKGLTQKQGDATATHPDGLTGEFPSLTYKANLKCRTCGKWQRGGSPCACDSPDYEPRPDYRNQAFQAWCEAWGREALRVTRPGGYLLAFGGTRTHHRLVCGLEDAGWIIRDELDWIYACLSDDTEILTTRGWLSYNEVSTNDTALAFDPGTGTLQREPIEAVHEYRHEGDMVWLHGAGTNQLVTLNHRLVLVDRTGVARVPSLRQRVLAALRPPSEVERPHVFEPLQRDSTLARSAVQDWEAFGVDRGRQGILSAQDEWSEQPGMEGWRYRLSEARELFGGAVRSRAGVGEADGSQGRLHHGAPPTDGRPLRLPDDQSRGRESREPRSDRQPLREFDALALQSGSQAVRVESARDGWSLVPSGPVAAEVVDYAGVVWCITVPSGAFVARRGGLAFLTGNSGFPKGKANLKPAHEPIVLARKPGPLQPLAIDECRIGTGERPVMVRTATVVGANAMAGESTGATASGEVTTAGRWPSNLLLSDPELFDEPNPYVVGSGATSESGAAGKKGSSGFAAGYDGEYDVPYGDRGGYSRFFVIPKSSRQDREPATMLDHACVEPSACGVTGFYCYNYGKRLGRVNVHPTCKPTDLMAHLIRLVCPPDGVILDPFLGSGSTAIAAEREGVKWIGIEKEPEYVAIAEARLNGTQRGLGLDVGAPTKPRKVVDGVWTTERGYDKGQTWYDWRETGEDIGLDATHASSCASLETDDTARGPCNCDLSAA